MQAIGVRQARNVTAMGVTANNVTHLLVGHSMEWLLPKTAVLNVTLPAIGRSLTKNSAASSACRTDRVQ